MEAVTKKDLPDESEDVFASTSEPARSVELFAAVRTSDGASWWWVDSLKSTRVEAEHDAARALLYANKVLILRVVLPVGGV